MKTSKKITFPKLENEFLENILRQLISQHHIIQMFFTKDTSSLFSHLIIHIEKNSDAQELQQSKWVKKVRNRYRIDVQFIYSVKFQHKFSFGHPFIECCCQPSALIYQNEESGDSTIIARGWKKYKKKFNVFQEGFYHDHDIHKSHVQNLISEGSQNSVFTSYARLIEYDLAYLEDLYAGTTFNTLDLDERINNLMEYIPEIQKYFVKNSGRTYYLTDVFAKAKEATADDDAIYQDEMYEAVGISEQSLFHLVENRLNEVKKQLKKTHVEKQEVLCPTDTRPKAEALEIAIGSIVNLVEVEQVYLFHQVTYGEKTTYCLMLIANGGTNEKLRAIIHFLKSKIAKSDDFVLISHSRKWIQENLYRFQSFFADIIQDKYLIHSSNPYHPELHWIQYDNPCHGDLYFYYKPTHDVALQFFEIADNPKENFQGLEYLFSLFFLSFCRTYIYVKTYYLPNDLSSQALWQLCIYADADIRKYNYLLEQFWTDCFPYLNKHRVLHHKLSKLDKEQVVQMKVIVEKLTDELHELVVEGRLLDF